MLINGHRNLIGQMLDITGITGHCLPNTLDSWTDSLAKVFANAHNDNPGVFPELKGFVSISYVFSFIIGLFFEMILLVCFYNH